MSPRHARGEVEPGRDCRVGRTDLVGAGCALEAVLAGPVLGGGELGVEGGEVEEDGGALKGEAGERDRGRGKDVVIRKGEADLGDR